MPINLTPNKFNKRKDKDTEVSPFEAFSWIFLIGLLIVVFTKILEVQ